MTSSSSSRTGSMSLLGGYLLDHTNLFRRKPALPAFSAVALISPDFDKDRDYELQIFRDKFNKLIKRSSHLRQLLVWDSQQDLTTSVPFHHAMHTLQKYNVQGLCVLLRYSSQKEVIKNVVKLCSFLWAKNSVPIKVDESCPPLPLLVVVIGGQQSPAGDRSDQDNVETKLRLHLNYYVPAALRRERIVKIKYIPFLSQADQVADNAALWLKRTVRQYCQDVSLEKMFRRERVESWKEVAREMLAVDKPKFQYGPRRSHSQPIIIPRRKPYIPDEALVTYGEPAQMVAAQLRSFDRDERLWEYKLPRTRRIHAVYLELIAIREQVRSKLIRRRQYFHQMGVSGSPATRFYTRFQWIKTYSGQATNLMIIYFQFGSVVEFNIARLKFHFKPMDIQILRSHLLNCTDSRQKTVAAARARVLTDQWTQSH